MMRLVFFPLAGFVLATAGCGGSGGPEAFSETSYQSAVIPGVNVPPPPGAASDSSKSKTRTRAGLQLTSESPATPPEN